MILFNYIFFNGIFDLISGLSLLEKINLVYFKNLYIKLFKENIYNNNFLDFSLNERLIGYILINTGILRIITSAIIIKNIVENEKYELLFKKHILMYTYLFEFLYIFEEFHKKNTIILEKGFIVCYYSILMSILILLNE
jgi:hypothetical protein